MESWSQVRALSCGVQPDTSSLLWGAHLRKSYCLRLVPPVGGRMPRVASQRACKLFCLPQQCKSDAVRSCLPKGCYINAMRHRSIQTPCPHNYPHPSLHVRHLLIILHFTQATLVLSYEALRSYLLHQKWIPTVQNWAIGTKCNVGSSRRKRVEQ